MSVGRSYARALVEGARESGLRSDELEKIQTELDGVLAVFLENTVLRESLLSPVVSSSDKAAIVGAFAEKMRLSKIAQQFLQLVAKKERFKFFSEIMDSFLEERVALDGSVLGEVVSSEELSSTDLDDLSASFSKKLGKKMVFKTKVDPSLLAGLKVTVNGITYDGSLRSQLQQLRDRLVYGAISGNT